MALTAEEEEKVRALLAALEKLPDPKPHATRVEDQKQRQVTADNEAYLRDLVRRLRP